MTERRHLRLISGGLAPDRSRSFFTADELADLIAVSPRRVRKWLADGTIPSHRYGRSRVVLIDEFEAYSQSVLSQRTPNAPSWVGGYDDWDEDERDYAYILRGDPCSYCGGPAEAVDHIVPRAGGGEHAWPNFTAACMLCNSGKVARPLLTFLLKRSLSEERKADV